MRPMRSPLVLEPTDLASDITSEPRSEDPDQARTEATEAIATRARERGFATFEDVLDALPDIQLSPEQIEEFLAHVEHVLRDEGIEIIDIPGEDGAGAPETEGSRRRQGEELLKAPAQDPVRMYLKEIGRVPLLTAAQEVDLAMRIEAGEFSTEFITSLDGLPAKVDQKRFRRVLESVVKTREHQLDLAKRLRNEGIGSEKISRSYRPKTREELLEFCRRVERDGQLARKRLIEAN